MQHIIIHVSHHCNSNQLKVYTETQMVFVTFNQSLISPSLSVLTMIVCPCACLLIFCCCLIISCSCCCCSFCCCFWSWSAASSACLGRLGSRESSAFLTFGFCIILLRIVWAGRDCWLFLSSSISARFSINAFPFSTSVWMETMRTFEYGNQLMSYFDVICFIWHQMSYYDKWHIRHRNMTLVNFANLGV